MGPAPNAILDVLRAHPCGLEVAALVAAVDVPERSARKALHRVAAAGAVQIGPTAFTRTATRAPRRSDYSGLLAQAAVTDDLINRPAGLARLA
jgi:hypothetical protein